MSWWKRKKRLYSDIDPDEIFLDAANLPQFDQNQFEGRIEKPICSRTLFILGMSFFVIGALYVYRIGYLQIAQGEEFLKRSENNRLHHEIVFSERGVILDRNGEPLASNIPQDESSDFPKRSYIKEGGFSLLLGYVKYPSKDKTGFYYKEDYDGYGGIEKYYNDLLKGTNGKKLTETDALGKITSTSVLEPPKHGEELKLTVDSKVQAKLYSIIKKLSADSGFDGGAGAIMDVHTGEVLAITSYPEYDSNVMTDGQDSKVIGAYFKDKRNPFIERAIDGLYTPGSIIKPYMAIAALEENTISPNKQILSTGSISIQNPYDPKQKTVFKDWKAHGWVDMRHAISVSSDVYFYAVGGGYADQKGLGIMNIEKYMKLFGFGQPLPDSFFSSKAGQIPNPEWKAKTFPTDSVWRLGNTYHSSIGQYGFQVTPMQALRAVASLANDGKLLSPVIIKDAVPESKPQDIPVSKEHMQIAREGMRLSVTEGVAKGLSMDALHVAAKTGTAELGVKKDFVNSWVTGFFPYENPKYAFVVMMERGSVNNTVGGVFVMRTLLEWMYANTPEYVR
jgi:penicillin-binding protein 2